MAEQEDIIIIEDSDAATNKTPSVQDEVQKSSLLSKIDKKTVLIIAGAVIFLILLVVLALFLYKKKHHAEPLIASKEVKEKVQKEDAIEPSNLENMIAKADYLYSKGSKTEALALYEKIAIYSEAVSAYNLGVAQLKDAQYEAALLNFQRAIDNNENRCVSAINAAVCSLYLNDEEKFNRYIDLAHAYLPTQAASPLYSYYYSLINYYKSNYYEALNSLNNSTTSEYAEIQNNLSAKINAMFDNNHKAIESLEKNSQIGNSFSLGLLYAKIGNLSAAREHFQNALIDNIEPMRSQIALCYVNLKSGDILEAAKNIENASDMYQDKVYEPYPLRVELKRSLFDTQEAQFNYREVISKNKSTIYQKIFYFSPYKTFNANQTVNHIRKGTANIYVDNVGSAKEYLEKGVSSSSTNKEIVVAIQKALDFKIRDANEILKKLVEVQPKNSILHYNLALTYAQLDNMADAYKHFLRSYNLDAKNYLAGIFAIMTSQLIEKDSTKLTSLVKDSLMNETSSEDVELYKTLLFIAQDNYIAATDWLERKSSSQSPFYTALDAIIAMKLNNLEVAQKSTQKLISLLPNEIIPHAMYIDAYFSDKKEKEYASNLLNYLKIQKFDFNDLYYGPHITRYIYVQQNLMIGKLFYLREQLKDVLSATPSSPHEITAALALASLYDKAYEESFVQYNNLIDNLKVKDTQTLFLAAVSSIAANHHENAIALLELSKMREASFLESRYALGLLYLEAKNNRGAIAQFAKMNKNFISQYFDFSIDTQKLLFEKNKAKP